MFGYVVVLNGYGALDSLIAWLVQKGRENVKFKCWRVDKGFSRLARTETPREILSLQKTMNKLELFVFKEVADGV